MCSDNVAFSSALSVRVRRRVEEFGRVELTDAEAKALSVTKGVHVAMIVFVILYVVWTKEFMSAFVAYPMFLLGRIAEIGFQLAAADGGGAVEAVKDVAKSFFSMVFGFALNFWLIALAHNGHI